MFVYLDNSATTRPYDEVTRAVTENMTGEFGNPSSLHRMGIRAEKAVREARKNTAASMGVPEQSLFFNSGGTEGDNTAIFGAAASGKHKGRRIITTAVEHPAVLEAFRRLEQLGYEAVYLGVDREGRADPAELAAVLNENTCLVSVMWVNNELGTVQPVEEMARITRTGSQALFHTDAVQAHGKIPLTITGEMDLVSVSAHKIHGPKGVGALYVRPGVHIEPFLRGGGQERGFRSGTENVQGIVGLGKAAEILNNRQTEVFEKMAVAKERLRAGLTAEVPDIRFNSPEEGCCPGILNVSFLGCRGEVLLHMLEEKEIYVSTGSACSSKKKGSHVLTAAGVPDKAIEGALRFSLAADNTVEQMDYVVDCIKTAAAGMRRLLKRR